MKQFVFSLFALAILFALAGSERVYGQSPQGGSVTIGKPWRGAPGIVETVAEIMRRERDAPAVPAPGRTLTRRRPQPRPSAPINPTSIAPSGSAPRSAAPQVPFSPQTIGFSFLGVQLAEASPPWRPPDTMGAVGPAQILFVENGRVKVFDKSGILGGLDTTLDNFFVSIRNSGQSAFDPRTRYDRLSGRWFVSSLDFGNRVLLAVSSSSTITGTSSFTFYQFQFDQVGTTPNADTGFDADFDTLGVDKNSVYIGINVFAGSAYNGTTGFVIHKAGLLSGTLTVTPFRQLTTCISGCVNGPFAPLGVDNDDPLASEGYFIGNDNIDMDKLVLRRVTYPGGIPAISANIFITVPTTTYPIPVPARDSTFPIDGGDTRLINALVMKNKVTGTNSLWTAQGLEVDSSGAATVGGNRDGARWYEIGNLTGAPTVLQSATLYDSAASAPQFFFFPSVAMSGQGHVALGASMASVNHYASIVTAGRLSGDSLNTMQPSTLALTGVYSYNTGLQGCCYRWGDYTQTVVDPNDDMTLWTFQESAEALSPSFPSGNWGVRAIQLIAPPPATPTSASPPSVTRGRIGVNVVITGTSVAGSGFFDPGPDTGGPGYAKHIRASVTGGVKVLSTSFNSPTLVTLTISTCNASNGNQDITIINPDGQSVTGNGLLNITGAPGICYDYLFPLIYR